MLKPFAAVHRFEVKADVVAVWCRVRVPQRSGGIIAEIGNQRVNLVKFKWLWLKDWVSLTEEEVMHAFKQPDVDGHSLIAEQVDWAG